jgi:hypothetical protein
MATTECSRADGDPEHEKAGKTRMPLKNGVKQRHDHWCVVAAIESVLRDFGEMEWTQERILQQWQTWKGTTPSFDLESPARFLPYTALDKRFRFEFRDPSLDEARRILRERSGRAAVTIVSCAEQSSAHMRVVTQFDGNAIEVFDPWDGEHHVLAWSDLAPKLGGEGRPVHMLLIDPK